MTKQMTFFVIGSLRVKIFSGMANNVDPDQTALSGAVWSGSALIAYVILSETLMFEILGHLGHLSYLFLYKNIICLRRY